MKKNYLLICCLFILTAIQVNAQTTLNDVPAFSCTYDGLDASTQTNRKAPTNKLISYLELNNQKCNVDESASRSKVYVDKTASVINVKRGATYSLKMAQKVGFSWMHTALWIDYDNNGSYAKEAGYTVDSNSELVSFDYYSTNAESDAASVKGINSRGNTDIPRAGFGGMVGNVYSLPQFTIPADASLGQKRVRFTCNWGSIDPSGLLPENSVGGSGNSAWNVDATIVDFIINIEENTSAVIFEQPAIGGTFTVKQAENEISSNDKFVAGTEFTIETAPNLGFHVLAIKVNGVTIEGYTFILGSTDATVTVEYIADTAGIFTFSAGANGSITVESNIDGVLAPITSGSIVEQGTQIKVTVTPNNNYLLNNVMLNGEDKTSTLNNGVLMFDFPNYNMEMIVSFKKDPNIIEYCTPNINRGSDDRYFSSLAITGATSNGEAQSFSSTLFSSSNRQTKVYVDRLNEKLKATSGDELTVSFTKGGSSFEWTHFYVYVDYNHDGEFDTEKELVSYTYLDKSHEFDSKGVTRDASYCPNACPSFIIPSDITSGETRIRIKADWANSDPCGDAKIGENRGTIIDYTIDFQKAICIVTYAQPENNYGTFKVKNGDIEISNGDEVNPGTILTVETTPLSNEYEVKAILVNGKAITGNTVIVKNDTEIAVEFIKGRFVTYNVNEGGTLQVKSGETIIESNTTVDFNSELNIMLKANTGYELTSFTVNGQEMKNEVGSDGTYTISNVTENILLNAIFAKLTYKLTYSFNDEFGNVRITDSGVTIENEQMLPYNTNLIVTVSPNEQCNIKSLLLNGEEKKEELQANGNSFTMNLIVTQENSLSVEFEASKYSLTYENPQYGTLEVKNEANEIISNASEIPYSSLLNVVLTPASDNELTSLIVNDGMQEMDYVAEDAIVKEDGKYTTQIQVFGNVTITATFSVPTGIHNATMENCKVYSTKEGNIVVENVEIGSTIEIYNATGQSVKKQFAASNQEVIFGASSNNSVYLIKISNGVETMIKKVIKK